MCACARRSLALLFHAVHGGSVRGQLHGLQRAYVFFLPHVAERAGGGDGDLPLYLADVEEREVLLACNLGRPDYGIPVLRELVRAGALLVGSQDFIVGEQRFGKRVQAGGVAADHRSAACDGPQGDQGALLVAGEARGTVVAAFGADTDASEGEHVGIGPAAGFDEWAPFFEQVETLAEVAPEIPEI